MKGGLRRREFHALLAGVLIVTLSVAYRYIALPYISSARTLHASLADERGLLAREIGVLEAEGRYDSVARVASAGIRARADRLFGAPTRELFVASVERYLTAAAASHGLRNPHLTGRGNAEHAPGVWHAEFDLEIEGALLQALRFIHQFESSDTLFRIERVVLGASASQADVPPGTVRLALSISAFALDPDIELLHDRPALAGGGSARELPR